MTAGFLSPDVPVSAKAAVWHSANHRTTASIRRNGRGGKWKAWPAIIRLGWRRRA